MTIGRSRVIHRIQVPSASPVQRDHLALGGGGVSITSRWIERDGVPILPVSAEVHFSRIPRVAWEDEIDRIAAAGITVVATYVIWIHHEEHEGDIRFDGSLDVRAFVEACVARGLDVFLRIGPWAHAEARNGGLPDWVLKRPMRVRSNDPEYLALARRWFAALAGQLRGVPLVALQVENELYDDPDHLTTLIALAREVGLSAPIWTATAWGGAQLPSDGVLPLFAGYSEAFWIAHDAGFDAASASNFYFSDERDEVGVGGDTRDSALRPGNLDLERFPYATCELGGGMPPSYHRRPIAHPHDVAALAHTKLGSGSNWQGYYMFHDGINPRRGLQESHATGSANDFTELSYDFGAPLGVFGDIRPTFGLLRMQHHAIRAFGRDLARLPAVFPADHAVVPDDTTLRWSVRSDGRSGFLFVTNHQPHVDLPWHRDVEFAVELADGEEVRFPAVDIGPGEYFFWPIRMDWSGGAIDWATAQPVTQHTWRGAPLLVLAADREAQVCIDGIVRTMRPGDIRDGLMLVTRAEAARLQLDGEELVFSDALLTRNGWFGDAEGAVIRRLTDVGLDEQELPGIPLPPSVPYVQVRAADGATHLRIGPRGRASAPTESDWRGAARYELDVRGLPASSRDLRLAVELDWRGDAARAFADGRLIDDRFFRGEAWRLPLDLAEGADTIVVEILPLAADAPVFLPADVRATVGEDGLAADLRGVGVRGIQRVSPAAVSRLG